MAVFLQSLKQGSQLLRQPSLVSQFIRDLIPSSRVLPTQVAVRESSQYKAYPEYPDPGEPYHPKRTDRRYGYHYKYWKGGVLPRPEGHYEDKPLNKLPKINFKERDQWTHKKAQFGQNDYIDILGDGSVHPWQLMKGPVWLRGFKGSEMQRLVRRMQFEGKLLKEVYPSKYHELNKQLFYRYKHDNRRRHAPFWSGRGAGGRSRLTNRKDRPR